MTLSTPVARIVTGQAHYSEATAEGLERAFVAEFTQTWIWDPNAQSRGWSSEWTVQPFAPRS